MNCKVSLRVVNSQSEPRVIVLEPWTGEYTLQPHKEFLIVAEGDPAWPMTVELADNRVYVHTFASEGADMTIFQDGVEIVRSE